MQRQDSYTTANTGKFETASFIRALLLGCACGLTVCAVLLAAAAFALVKSGYLPIDALSYITLAVSIVGAFFAGYMAVRVYGKRGLVTGCAAGALMFVVLLIISLTDSGVSGIVGVLVKCVACVSAAGIGGVLRVNRKRKH